ncbi:hypothetical protein QR98_0033950 [Sarcoptes scabiei]|uniref:Uncharacterized protein n=1 Tax=Sarcoptes scabiei TaxID=52283 RepID=A0A132A3I9_SARSC|nr:hypothetical protein QR98_0033950 [Sarcoptes scabiei]
MFLSSFKKVEDDDDNNVDVVDVRSSIIFFSILLRSYRHLLSFLNSSQQIFRKWNDVKRDPVQRQVIQSMIR